MSEPHVETMNGTTAAPVEAPETNAPHVEVMDGAEPKPAPVAVPMGHGNVEDLGGTPHKETVGAPVEELPDKVSPANPTNDPTLVAKFSDGSSLHIGTPAPATQFDDGVETLDSMSMTPAQQAYYNELKDKAAKFDKLMSSPVAKTFAETALRIL